MTDRRRLWAAVLGAVALTAIVYAPVCDYPFVNLDDQDFVYENPNLLEGSTGSRLVRAFTTPHSYNWIPLTSLSLLLDYELFGLDAGAFHATNLLLHALGTALLLVGVAQLVGSVPVATFVALVFALHPLHVESVAWVSSRKDVLSGVWFGCSLLAYARYARAPSARRMGPVALCVGLGLLSKPTAVTLPFVLLLLDVWPLGRLSFRGVPEGVARSDIPSVTLRGALLEKLPLLGLVALAGLATWSAQESAMWEGPGAGALVRVANAATSYAAFLGHAVWPSGLAVFYPHPGESVSFRGAAAAGALLLTISALVVAQFRRRPHLAVGWLWFLGVLVPMIGLVQVGWQARADRHTYLALTGLALPVAVAGRELARRGPALRGVVIASACAATLAMSAATRAQLETWRDSVVLYERALAVTDDNFVAHFGLAGALAEEGRLEEAIPHLREAIRLRRQWALPRRRLADTLFALGRYDEAADVQRRLIRRQPRDARHYEALGRTLLALGQPARAVEAYERALELQGDASSDALRAALAGARAAVPAATTP